LNDHVLILRFLFDACLNTYTVGRDTPRLNQTEGNRTRKQILWGDDDNLLATWRNAKVGFPWSDAIMTQLRQPGWRHHLACDAVAYFLTPWTSNARHQSLNSKGIQVSIMCHEKGEIEIAKGLRSWQFLQAIEKLNW
jgi:hypothetical protein